MSAVILAAEQIGWPEAAVYIVLLVAAFAYLWAITRD